MSISRRVFCRKLRSSFAAELFAAPEGQQNTQSCAREARRLLRCRKRRSEGTLLRHPNQPLSGSEYSSCG